MGREDDASMVDRALHLLWVIARWDVENLSNQRSQLLRELRDVEMRMSEPRHLPFYEQLLGAVENGHR
jgi:hypothetical protein